jgi:hypothetical protein
MKITDKRTILVRSAGVSFHTTAGAIREGVGNYSSFNAACTLALGEMENFTDEGSRDTRGVMGTWRGVTLQLDMLAV